MSRYNSYTRIPNCKAALALVGRARHGKDTAAKMLLKMLPGAERFAFSDYVATVARTHHGMTIRHAPTLQQLGMQLRDQNTDIWLDALYGQLCDREPEYIILTGVRFMEEVKLLSVLAPRVALLHIVRVDARGEFFVSGDRDPNYRSEANIDNLGHRADYRIFVGPDDFSGLHNKLSDAVNHLLFSEELQ